MTLPSGWYAFAAPSELKPNRPNLLRRFGENWVIWKSKTLDWIAQSDRCPHRSASLSGGQVLDNCIVCPFHGFRFDPSGSCTFVPEINRNAPGLKLKTFSLVEKNEFLWIRWGSPISTEISWFSELENSGFTYRSSKHIWKQNFSRCVENQLDYAHLPFIHSKSIGRNFNPAKKVTWKLEKTFLRVYLGEEGPQTGYFEFRYPNIWKLSISDKMVQTLMFIPVNEDETWIYARAYHRFTQLPILKEMIAWVSAHVANPFILSEDQRVVLTQDPRDVRTAKEEHLFPSDRAIQEFRKWLQEV